MLGSLLLATALGASAVAAAPTWPSLNPASASKDGMDTVSEYFNMLARKVDEAGRDAWQSPTCDLSQASLPQAPKPLDAPSAGLVLKHVAVGRGTQNYTCARASRDAEPAAAGAVATLFNASCVAAAYPDLLALLPRLSLKFDLPDPATFEGHNTELGRWLAASSRLGPSSLGVSGHHYFTDLTTAFFNLDTPELRLGEASCAKESSTDAPTSDGGSSAGPDGAKAVPWLKLAVKPAGGDTETAELAAGLAEVYRVQTAGGSPPSTCEGQPPEFQVQYAAEYWFYEQLTT